MHIFLSPCSSASLVMVSWALNLLLKAKKKFTETEVVDAVGGVRLPGRLPHLANKQTQRDAQLVRTALQNLRLEQLRTLPSCRPTPTGRSFELFVLRRHPLLPCVDSVRVLEPHLRVVNRGVGDWGRCRTTERLLRDEGSWNGLVVVVLQPVHCDTLPFHVWTGQGAVAAFPIAAFSF